MEADQSGDFFPWKENEEETKAIPDVKIPVEHTRTKYESCEMGTLGCQGKLMHSWRNVYYCSECEKEDFSQSI